MVKHHSFVLFKFWTLPLYKFLNTHLAHSFALTMFFIFLFYNSYVSWHLCSTIFPGKKFLTTKPNTNRFLKSGSNVPCNVIYIYVLIAIKCLKYAVCFYTILSQAIPISNKITYIPVPLGLSIYKLVWTLDWTINFTLLFIIKANQKTEMEKGACSESAACANFSQLC